MRMFHEVQHSRLLAVGPMHRVDIPELFWDILRDLSNSADGPIMVQL
jgi:hypothetical protein